MSTSGKGSDTWSRSVEKTDQTDIAERDESWSKFLRLIEPERTYTKFFVWLTKSIQLMPLYKGCNVSAEDVAGDTIVRVLRSMSKGTEINKGTFNAFVIRVAKNYLIDYKRHGTGEVLLSLLDLRESKTIEPDTESHFRFWMLLKAEPDLDDDDMQLLQLLSRGFSGMEIAAELDISEQSARKRVSRFRKKLRNKLIEIREREAPSGEQLRVKIGNIEMKAVDVSGLAQTVMQFPGRKATPLAVTHRFWIGGEHSFIARAEEGRSSLEKARVARARITQAEEARSSLEKVRLACARITQAEEARSSLEKARLACARITQAEEARSSLEKARLACARITQAQVADTKVSAKVTSEMKQSGVGYAAVAQAFELRKLENDLLSVLASELKAAGRFCPLPGFIGDQLRKNSAAGD